MKVKLKSRKELEAMGYVYNPKSIFIPMSIDVLPSEKRLVDNKCKIISSVMFKLLGKSAYVDIDSAHENCGVMCARFYANEKEFKAKSWKNAHIMPLIVSSDLVPEVIKNNLAKEEEHRKKLKEKEAKEKVFLEQNNALKFKSKSNGEFSAKYFYNTENFKISYYDLTRKDMADLHAFLGKQLQIKKGKI